jgi:hypothetical protein
MAKKNYRIFYHETEVNNLREKVKCAYTESTKTITKPSGEIFDDGGYKLSHQYKELIRLLENFCPSYKRNHGDILSDSTLHKFFTSTPITRNSIIGFNFEQRTIEILNSFASACKSPQTITITQANHKYNEDIVLDEVKMLQNYYEQDEIDVGVAKANEAYDRYGSHPQILKHVFRFNMRKKEWERIRGIVDKVLKENPSDMIQTQCYLSLFECELREANSIFKSDRKERSKKILYGRTILNKVPISQHKYEQYLYWHGKWCLELWHCSNGDDLYYLKQAQLCFEKALAKKYTFWYHCYKCITLKLLNNKTFSEEVKKFTEFIIKEKLRQPNRPAVRTYRITSFVLNDDMKGLKIFLKEHNIPSSPTDFQFTIFNHVELIFYTDNAKHIAYKSVLEDWIANLPLK